MPPETDVAIVGSGPYALSVAAQLRARAIEFRIFGPPMKFWRDMPRGINLKSYAFATNIYAPGAGHGFPEWCRARGLEDHEPCTMASFAEYGLWAQQKLVPQLEPVEVRRVAMIAGEKFHLELATGEALRARRVVFATGLSGLGQVPEILRGLPRELVSHSFEHSDFAPFSGQRVAVVGGGASAVEAGALVHEAGGSAEVLVRDGRAVFHDRGPRQRPLWDRLRHPNSVLGPGRRNWALSTVPFALHFVPEARRVPFVLNYLGPASPWWIRDRIEGKVPLHLNTSVVAAERVGSKLRLRLRHAEGERALEVDHVIAGTGYAYDLDRLAYLDAGLRARLRRVERAPALSLAFESSVKGAYFVGPIAGLSFGPLFRFVCGAEFAAPAVARHLAGPVRRVTRRLRDLTGSLGLALDR